MTDEQEIRALIENWVSAVHTGDLDTVLADHAPDIVMFDVPPPYDGVRGLDAYRETWPGFFEWQQSGASFDMESLDVTAGTDVAFAFALLRCGTPDENPDQRLRLTIGLRKLDGRWKLVHQHVSVPFDMASRIAGELNALLPGIGASGELAQGSAGARQPSYQALEEVQRARARIALLARELQAFGGHQMLQLHAVNINDQIGSLQTRIQQLLGSRIELVQHLSPDHKSLMEELFTRFTPIPVCEARHHDRVLTHGAILKAIWGANAVEQTEHVWTLVALLRKKIEPDPSHPRYLLSAPWVGYRFAVEPPDA